MFKKAPIRPAKIMRRIFLILAAGFYLMEGNTVGVEAFTTSPAPVALQEELGCSPTLAAILQRTDDDDPVYFDPLGLATDDNFARYREAELKHGRVAMLSVVYSVATSLEQYLIIQPTEGNDRSGGSFLQYFQERQIPSLYSLIFHHTAGDWYKFLSFCGILETLVLVQIDVRDLPGDYGVGYFGVRDNGRNERALISELENGRLAMLVMLYYLVQDILQVEPGQYPDLLIGQLLWHG